MANMTISISDSDKKYFTEFCEQVGFSANALINFFIKTVIRKGEVPFKISIDKPNQNLLNAMNETEKMLNNPDTKYYSNLDEMWNDIEK